MLKTDLNYKIFLSNNFKGLKLKAPLFYNWPIGIRFNLQVDETNTKDYFKEVTTRAFTIFETAFTPTDSVFLVLMDYKYKRRKIRFSNIIFKEIDNLKKSEISYSKLKQLYEPNDKFDIWNVAIIKLITARINHKNILTAISHTDFPSNIPRLDQNKEVYFVNIDKKLILHMYDDRGLDLVSTEIETLRPIYNKYKNWILECDRVAIDKQFE